MSEPITKKEMIELIENILKNMTIKEQKAISEICSRIGDTNEAN